MKSLTLAATVLGILILIEGACVANGDAVQAAGLSADIPGPLPVPAAGVRLSKLFSDNMVLQSGVKCPIWGSAQPGSTVEVAIAGQKASAKVGPDGQWRTTIGPLQPGEPFDMTVTDGQIVTIKNVAVGEVWICSGQSNMELSLGNCLSDKAVDADAHWPMVRMFTVTKQASATPLNEATGDSENLHNWVVFKPRNWVQEMSAVGYFFARDLHKRLNVPVGIINASTGGTPVEAWTSPETVASEPAFAPLGPSWEEIARGYPSVLNDWKAEIARWQIQADAAKAAKLRAPYRPQPPVDPNGPLAPSKLYNAMIHPLVPYAIKGAIWYQGEANAPRAFQYRKLFPALIRDWRGHWGQGDFPFLFVQLANWMDIRSIPVEPSDDCWAELREVQTMTLKVPNTGMAVAIDLGDYGDIHPKRKSEVAERLTLAAMKVAYGQDLVYSGPIYESMKVEENRIRLHFTSVGSGLMAKGDELQGFAIAGQSHNYVWAKAKIDGDSVVVWSDDVAAPVAVRYAWAGFPTCNLYNKEGLPASPFRTDDWPGIGTKVAGWNAILTPPISRAGASSLAVPAAAGVKLPALFSDNMLLQSGVNCPIWGAAAPGSTVEIAIAGQKLQTKVNSDGQWRTTIGSLKPGGPLEMTLTVGGSTTTIKNIAVGEVWICSGQSNMSYNVGSVRNVNVETAAADFPMLRLFTVARKSSKTPLNDAEGKWIVCSPDTVQPFAAVGYFFGRDLHKRLNVPVGMINASWGGSSVEEWTSPEMVAAQPAMRDTVAAWQDRADNYPSMLKKSTDALAKWEQDVKVAAASGRPTPLKPWQPHNPFAEGPSTLYNGMVRPLIPYAIKGVVWYQGESNGSGIHYRGIFPTMISNWRWQWGQGDFPFIFVQLPNFRAVDENSKDLAYGGTWPEIREAQTMALKLPNTGMAVSIDVGDPFDVHPKSGKDVIGNRLMLATLKVAYGQDIPYSGPIYDSMKIGNGKARIHFSHVFGGLSVAGALQGFTIAGEDGKFVPGTASLDGNDSVVVWNIAVPNPVAVRYGWGQSPTCSLYNKADLPASPFRTDDLPSPIRLRLYSGGWFGPQYESMKVQDGKIHVRFFNVFGGLEVHGDEMQGFTIAGADGKFLPAKGKIEGDDTIVLWNDAIPDPLSARYAWEPDPVCNLSNKEGVPATPFRTDDWPGPATKMVSDPNVKPNGPKYQSPISLRPIRIETANELLPNGFSGPRYQSMAIEGGKVRIKFDGIGSGLMVHVTSEGGMIYKNLDLQGFSIAGEDRKFVWARARIDGDSVVVWSDAVANPVVVRYAMTIVPTCNLYCKEGLPAYPFRTDN